MKPTRLVLCLSLVCLPIATAVAEDAPANPTAKQATKEEIQARLTEHARRKAMGSTSASAAVPVDKKAAKPKTAPAAPPAAGAPTTDATAAAKAPEKTPAAEDPATVLPKLEVQKGKITELDRQLGQKNKEIAREKQNAKPTQLDETLNGPKISKALAVLGGQSSDDRSNVAKERVAMMEEERDLIEAIAQTQDKAEKEELQKTLDGMKAMRRELENSLH